MTFRYVPPGTLAQIDAWCRLHGYRVGRLETGPDGMLRGTCIVDPTGTEAYGATRNFFPSMHVDGG